MYSSCHAIGLSRTCFEQSALIQCRCPKGHWFGSWSARLAVSTLERFEHSVVKVHSYYWFLWSVSLMSHLLLVVEWYLCLLRDLTSSSLAVLSAITLGHIDHSLLRNKLHHQILWLNVVMNLWSLRWYQWGGRCHLPSRRLPITLHRRCHRQRWNMFSCLEFIMSDSWTIWM